MSKREKKYDVKKRTFRIFLCFSFFIFLVELSIMLLTSSARVSDKYTPFIDSFLLLLAVFPVTYFSFMSVTKEGVKREELEEHLKGRELCFASIVNGANDAIIVADSSCKIVFWNEAAEIIFGYTIQEATGLPLESIIPERYRKMHKKGFRAFVETEKPKIMGKKIEMEGLRKDGKEISIELSLANWKTEEGLFFTSIIRDVTKRKDIEKEIKYLAFYDSLTELPNRVMFVKSLNNELNRVKCNNKKLAVMFIDLDRFKNINDTMGHNIGDVLLKEVGNRLKGCIRKHDIIARLGGDEFTVLITKTKFPQNAAIVSERIIRALRPVFEIGDYKIHISPSIGIAVYPENGTNMENLLKNADTAMYCAKEQGRNNYKFCTSDMNEKISKLMKLETGLCEALEREEFVLHYQPKINIKTGEMLGMEALLRWQHPERGMILPGEFIPIAEERGIILAISEWVLRAACRQNKAWQKAGYSSMIVSVNLSARHFRKRNLETLVKDILEAEDLSSKCLELEITETCVIENTFNAIETLGNLSELGVQISLDDFGTGYSSLSYLKNLPINTVKIDCSFVSDITINRNNAAIVRAVITMAHEMDLKVVAEGVETMEQFHFLRQLGCDLAQGYLICPPLTTEQVTKLLLEQKPLVPPWNT